MDDRLGAAILVGVVLLVQAAVRQISPDNVGQASQPILRNVVRDGHNLVDQLAHVRVDGPRVATPADLVQSQHARPTRTRRSVPCWSLATKSSNSARNDGAGRLATLVKRRLNRPRQSARSRAQAEGGDTCHGRSSLGPRCARSSLGEGRLAPERGRRARAIRPPGPPAPQAHSRRRRHSKTRRCAGRRLFHDARMAATRPEGIGAASATVRGRRGRAGRACCWGSRIAAPSPAPAPSSALAILSCPHPAPRDAPSTANIAHASQRGRPPLARRPLFIACWDKYIGACSLRSYSDYTNGAYVRTAGSAPAAGDRVATNVVDPRASRSPAS